MDQLNLNSILKRENEEKMFINCLMDFEKNKLDIMTKRGIYIYGNPGSGKTMFVKNILKKLNYDILLFDAGDIRNKSIIENIAKYNMPDTNIMSLFQKKIIKKAIIMDEIDGMNSGDKGGINSLIKLIRPKKTKKQKKEACTMIPIICIGNYHIDKKIKELMKVCDIIELKMPTQNQIKQIASLLMKKIDIALIETFLELIQGDLRKLQTIHIIYKNQQNILKNKIIKSVFQQKTESEDTKQITERLLKNMYSLSDHSILMNETDRTSVGLLFHENIIDILQKFPKKKAINFYLTVLQNICFADYIDRITFQKQIWIFNEMSSLIKTLYNNKLLHDEYPSIDYNPSEIRFTKVLTKYSTEYNNMLFITDLCNQLNMDKKDMISYFTHLKKKYPLDEIYNLFDDENYEITKLDINRIYRFIDKYTYCDM
jgi:Cdc6-like AAA superfamily ATPase